MDECVIKHIINMHTHYMQTKTFILEAIKHTVNSLKALNTLHLTTYKNIPQLYSTSDISAAFVSIRDFSKPFIKNPKTFEQ